MSKSRSRPVTDAEIVALALREVRTGLDRALAILEARAPVPTPQERLAAFTDFTGLTKPEVMTRLRAHGYDGRAFGGMVNHAHVVKRSDGLYDGYPERLRP